MATLRSLKIKTSRCKQSVEELHTYEMEVEREAATVAYLRDEGDDPHWLKQEENMLARCRRTIPDCRKRMEAALEDLKGTLAEFLEETDKKEGPEIDEARNTIAEVEKFLLDLQYLIHAEKCYLQERNTLTLLPKCLRYLKILVLVGNLLQV
ncbi:hypothetical protein P8452_44932 [Trifolium repens]|nr:hypothetical protein P8452_44932 [Trifolium repens]